MLLLLAVYAYPLARMVGLSFGDGRFTLTAYSDFFATSVYVGVLFRTLALSLLVTLLCLALGFPVAYALAKARSAWRGFLLLLVLVPWLVTELVRNFAWVIILHPAGILSQIQSALGLGGKPIISTGTVGAVLIGMVYVQLPLAILPLYAVLRRVDLSLLQVAESLGAKPVRAIRLVLLPLIRPGFAAAGVMVFLTTLAFYVAPQILGGPADLFMANLIDIQLNRFVNWELGSALSVILVVSALAVLFVARQFIGLSWLTTGSASAAGKGTHVASDLGAPTESELA